MFSAGKNTFSVEDECVFYGICYVQIFHWFKGEMLICKPTVSNCDGFRFTKHIHGLWRPLSAQDKGELVD